MRLSRLSLLAAPACLLLLSACASGPQGPRGGGGPPQNFARGGDMPTGFMVRPFALVLTSMDLNADTYITEDEFTTGILTQWSLMDADQNDRATPVAFDAWAESAMGTADALPGRLNFDTDLNGAVTRDEFIAGMRREFRTLDKNEDGRIVRAELVSRLPDMQTRQAGGGQPQGRGPGGSGDRPPPRANG